MVPEHPCTSLLNISNSKVQVFPDNEQFQQLVTQTLKYVKEITCDCEATSEQTKERRKDDTSIEGTF